MAAAHDVEAFLASLAAKGGADLRANLRVRDHRRLAELCPADLHARGHGSTLRVAPSNESGALPLSWPGLGDLLPDGGLPRGVVELASPGALGGSTSVALAAVRAGQARGRRAWCAW